MICEGAEAVKSAELHTLNCQAFAALSLGPLFKFPSWGFKLPWLVGQIVLLFN